MSEYSIKSSDFSVITIFPPSVHNFLQKKILGDGKFFLKRLFGQTLNIQEDEI
jgi:hypothetical protein